MTLRSWLLDPTNLASTMALLSATVGSGWKVGKEAAKTLAPGSNVEGRAALYGALGGLWAAGYYSCLLYGSTASAEIYGLVSGAIAFYAVVLHIAAATA